MSTMDVVVASRREAVLARVADYVELCKPRIAVLELITVAVAACVASHGLPAEPWTLLWALAGTALVAASASALNQWIEIDSDRRMRRTVDRPLPAGRITPGSAVLFATITGLTGFFGLFLLVNPLTAWLGFATWFLYVWVYTPLKSRSETNTAVGAVAGALPILMGWAAADGAWTGQYGLLAATLFLLVFLWQFPHFMAIAWLYREEYARGGMQMLTVVDPSGRRAGAQAVLAALVLIPVSLLPPAMYFAGPVYFVAVLGLGVWQFICALRFCTSQDDRSARRLLRMSLVYLPAFMMLTMAAPLVFPKI